MKSTASPEQTGPSNKKGTQQPDQRQSSKPILHPGDEMKEEKYLYDGDEWNYVIMRRINDYDREEIDGCYTGL